MVPKSRPVAYIVPTSKRIKHENNTHTQINALQLITMIKENLALQDQLMSFLWYFPYDGRQHIFKTISPRAHKRFQEMRKFDTEKGRSLKPFDERKCIFVHIPKCAGVSISKSLLGNLGGGHLRIPHYELIFSKREFEDYFKFTFVRNPWDRLLSAFLFLKKGGANKLDKAWADEHLSCFEDFHAFVTTWVNRRNVNTWKHFVPQYKFVCEPGTQTPKVDFIGYFEHIGDDFTYIQKKLGINSNLQHLNKTGGGKREYKEYYTDTTREIVADVYEEDIRIFRYDFDNTFKANITDAGSLTAIPRQ
jgi:hypothetical protein